MPEADPVPAAEPANYTEGLEHSSPADNATKEPAATAPAKTPDPAPPAATDTKPPPYDAAAALRAKNAEIRRFREENARTVKELEDLKAWRKQQEAAAQPKPPDMNEDPVGALAALIEANNKETAAVRAEQERRVADEAAQRETARVENLRNQINAYGAQKYGQDFDRAVKHVQGAFVGFALRAQPGLDTETALQGVNESLLKFADEAVRNQQDPVEAIMGWAAEHGFARTPAAAPPPIPGAAVPAATDPRAAELAKQAAAQKAAQTVGGGGGAPAGITARQLLDMDPVESEDYFRAHPKQRKRYLSGELD